MPALAVAAFTPVALAAWGTRHAWQSAEAFTGRWEPFAWTYLLIFLILALQTGLAYLERPKRGPSRPPALSPANDSTVVLIPVYNEDTELVGRCLDSLLSQYRRPHTVVVVDDGSTVDYRETCLRFRAEAAAAGVTALWETFPENRGKRHAHAAAFRLAPDADAYITVDSDAILDYYAIEKILDPFADPRVQSVAGLVLIANHRRPLLPALDADGNLGRLTRARVRARLLAANCLKTLITRPTELWYVTGELTDRSAQSALGSVLVNTGTFAAYRGDVIRANIDGYVGETFAGRPVQFSDDSWLTFCALLKGKTVQQPTAIAFTAMPDNLSHHFRQYVRWMRGMTIRTFWRFRFLPVNRVAYWLHMLRWVQVFTAIPIFFAVIVAGPALHHAWSPELLIVPVAVGYGRSLRYFAVRRYDEPWWSQVITYLCAPGVASWQYTVLRLIWWYGAATCLRTGWGTRQHGVEVGLGGTPK